MTVLFVLENGKQHRDVKGIRGGKGLNYNFYIALNVNKAYLSEIWLPDAKIQFLKENRFSCCLLLNSSTILSLFIFLFNKSVFRAIFSRSALRIALRINNQAKSWTRSLTSVCPLALIRSSFYSTRLLVV